MRLLPHRAVLGSAAVLTFALALAGPVRASAQLPLPADAEGTPYLPVNINPTLIPPMVNVNPNGSIPSMDIRRLPPLTIASLPPVTLRPGGCADPLNFRTGFGDTVEGPFLLTYLNVPEGAPVRFATGDGETVEVGLGGDRPLATAIHLARGQTLGFDAPVLFSGCAPE
jgi:hypothetical protein